MIRPVQTSLFSDVKEYFAKPGQIKKTILVALSVLMSLGMILSYAIGAPWLVIAGFFLLSLAPLFPLGRFGNEPRSEIISN
jgi:hypothetical protein